MLVTSDTEANCNLL